MRGMRENPNFSPDREGSPGQEAWPQHEGLPPTGLSGFQKTLPTHSLPRASGEKVLLVYNHHALVEEHAALTSVHTTPTLPHLTCKEAIRWLFKNVPSSSVEA